ncbi:MAG: hypothetical protein NZZ41_02105 [Candidatus Dojkabacteria bacterium]|nr:hypothetical protein [Candidatus Dojkabacteria bacterium]
MPDIDIDVKDRKEILDKLDVIYSSYLKNDELMIHPTGVYFQDIPNFSYNDKKISYILYDKAEDLGIFKIDIINNHSYDLFSSNEEIDYYLSLEPKWDKLLDPEILKKLPHIRDYQELIEYYHPKSIEDLAIILALIRPGKKNLIGKPLNEIKKEIWVKNENEDNYVFKKSHAFSYAMMIILILNKLTYSK